MFGLILATFFTVIKSSFNLFAGTYELRGNLGEYIGNWLTGLVGGIGSILVLIFISVSILIFAFDIKIEKIFQFIKYVFERKPESDVKIIRKEDDSSNLDKIKKLRYLIY